MTQPAAPRVGAVVSPPRRPAGPTATAMRPAPTAPAAPAPILLGPEDLARAEVVVVADGPHPGPDAVTVAREIAARSEVRPGRVALLAHTGRIGAGGAPSTEDDVPPHPLPAHWVGPLLRSWVDRGLDWAGVQTELAAVRHQVAVTFGAASLREAGVGVAVGGVQLLDRGRLRFSGVFRGQAGPRREDLTLHPQRIVLATGAEPLLPDVRGIGETRLHRGDSVLDLPERPGSVVVVGGGAHGCEMAQALARAGCTVTIVEPGPRLLADLPDAAAQLVVDALEDDGVRMLTGVQLLSMAPTLDGGAWVGTDHGDVAAEAVVLATGRRARSAGLELAAAGVSLGSAGQVLVDDRLRTDVSTVLACGEVTGQVGYGGTPGPMARVVAANAAARRTQVRFEAIAPVRLTRTDPEVVVVGDAAAVREVPDGAVSGVSDGPEPGSSVQVVLAAPGGRGLLGRSSHGGRTLLAAVLVGPGSAEAAGQLVLAATAGVPAATLIDIDAPDGTWGAAVQSCVAHTLAGG